MNPTLKRAVIRRLGRESLRDVANHGADGGFPGFVYYAETGAFYAKHQEAIRELAQELANEFGEESVLSFVKGFRCIKDAGSTEDEIAQTLWRTSKYHDPQVANGLAWFALESVAREECPDA